MNSVALPLEYSDLYKEKALPRILFEAVSLYGTKEVKGDGSNPVIIGWAKEVGTVIKNYYISDAIAWCGLFMAVCAVRSGYEPPKGFDALRARQWATWGDNLPIPITPMLGDVLVFAREGGGHVGLYVGEDKECYHVLGGNQADMVNITRIQKARLITARRSPMNQVPKCVRRVWRSPKGKISTNEA